MKRASLRKGRREKQRPGVGEQSLNLSFPTSGLSGSGSDVAFPDHQTVKPSLVIVGFWEDSSRQQGL